MEIISPIKKVELEQLAVLDSFFPIEIKLSSDLRQLIIDYVFPRIVYEKDQDEKFWARFAVNLIENKYCYVIQVYNHETIELMSTFDITQRTFALGHFNAFEKYNSYMPVNVSWIGKSGDFNHEIRHYFCPMDGETYRLEMVKGEKQVYVLVMQCPKNKEKGWVSINSMNYKFIDIHNKEEPYQFDNYVKLITNYGSDWTKYPTIKIDDDNKLFLEKYRNDRRIFFSECDEFDLS
jgi:hypothetical protein